jgi:hypothetical protein
MIIDITAKHPLPTCENIVTIPEIVGLCPYEMIRVADYGGEIRYQIPDCPNADRGGDRVTDIRQCMAIYKEHHRTCFCKVALARRAGYTCPLGYRSPE